MLALGSKSLCLRLLQCNPCTIRQVRPSSGRSTAGNQDIDEDYSEARRWISNFGKSSLPRSIAKVRYDRSSGKGGQHVNKTNSKATVTWPIPSILSYIPKVLHSRLRSSRYYVASSDSLQMSAQSSRSQHDNEDECHQKLYDLLLGIGRQAIPGETSPEQLTKVERLWQVNPYSKGLCPGVIGSSEIHAARLRCNSLGILKIAALARILPVKRYRKADNADRLRMKKTHSAKKQSRSGRGSDY